MNLPERLPSHLLRTRWVRVSRFPNGKRLGRRSMVLDRCHNDDGSPHSILVGYVSDHPFSRVLGELPHVPRVVKSLYRKEVRLAHYQAKSCWRALSDMRKAENAWADYREAAS